MMNEVRDSIAPKPHGAWGQPFLDGRPSWGWSLDGWAALASVLVKRAVGS